MILKDGTEIEDPRLDRIYQLDWRSLDYPVTAKPELVKPISEYAPRSYTYATGDVVLDQGPDGACVGFSFAHDMRARPQIIVVFDNTPVDNDFAKRQLYWQMQMVDEWEGGSYPGAAPQYEGTSVLAGAKVLQKMGLYQSYYWGLDLQQVAIGVGYDGPCIIGINFKSGMFDLINGFMDPYGEDVGGHAMLIYGVKIVWKSWISRLVSRKWENVDLNKSYFLIKNSWGKDWGINGTCKMTLRNFDLLLHEQGDACFPKRTFSQQIHGL